MPESTTGILQRHRSTTAVLVRMLDALLIIVTLWLANLSFRHEWNLRLTLAAVIAVGVFFVVAEGSELYRSWRGSPLRQLALNIVRVWMVTAGLLFVLGWATKTTSVYSRLVMGTWMVSLPLMLILVRFLTYSLLRKYRESGRNTRRAAIVGLTQTARKVFDEINNFPASGLRVEGVFADPGVNRRRGEREWDAELTGDIKELCKRAKRAELDVIFIALPMSEERKIAVLLERLSDSTASIYLVPEFFVSNLLQMRWSNLGDIPAISIVETPFYGVDGWVKRFQDVLISLLLLPIVLIPFILIAIGVKLTTKGSVFFRQERYGLDGNGFTVWKFRSMYVSENGDKIVQAIKEDRRITRFGRYLRRTSLDELPQLINVLKGDMSIVGPRPHAVAHNEEYRRLIQGYMLRHKVKPGITGWAQVNGFRGETEKIEKMEKRVEYDLWYIQNWSFWMDLKIILLTISHILSGKNSY